MTELRKLGGDAVVLGASMAGLLAGRVLADHFERVVLIDRDELPSSDEPRKGVPQGAHIHILLDHGRQILESYFPGLADGIQRDGGLVLDPGKQLVWYQEGGYLPSQETDLRMVSVTRPFLERHVRDRVQAIENLEIRSGQRFVGYSLTSRGVEGVQTRTADRGREDGLDAELVVDAMGRNSPTPKWLAGSGFGAPEEEMVTVDMGYATRIWHRDPSEPHRGYMVQPVPPEGARAGFMLPIEGDRWISTICGWGTEHHAPTDDGGYLEAARSLAAPDMGDVMENTKPLGPVRRRRFPSSLRRHYERSESLPDGLVVLGDAVSSFNPVYGQGMTSAAMQAAVLDSEIQTGGLDNLHRRFFDETGPVVDMPWTQAVGADFRFPNTHGPKPRGTDQLDRYLSRFRRSMNRDEKLARAWIDVVNLTRPSRSLLAPDLAWRALLGS